MSYFKPLEFPEEKDPGLNISPKPTHRYVPEKIAVAVEKIEAELTLVRSGLSEHGPSYAIEPGPRGFAISNQLKIFASNSTDKTYQGVIQITLQDLGAKFTAFVQKELDFTKEIL